MIPIKTHTKIETIVSYFVIKKKSLNKLPKRARAWDYIIQHIERRFWMGTEHVDEDNDDNVTSTPKSRP